MSRSYAAFRAVLCLSTALMMAISWPLWVTAGSFPRVPWFGWVRLLPAWASWVRFVAALTMIVAASTPMPRRRAAAAPNDEGTSASPGRLALLVGWGLSAWMVLEDQFRLQPWMYQFLIVGFAIAACPSGRAMRLACVFAIALYLHSGLSKLDYQFANEMGRWFLFHGASVIGLKLKSWSDASARAIIFAMPCFEIAIAVALAVRARRVGVVGAVAMHLALIAILGPWGMNHSANVLLWNTAMMIEVVVLFWPPPGVPAPRPVRRITQCLPVAVASALVWAAAILPLGERSGWWDTWPSFALYSGSNETLQLAVPDTPEAAAFPWNGRSWSATDGGWLLIDLRKWSLKERRVPLYPSSRALNGVVEGIARRYPWALLIRVAHEGRADRRTGARDRVVLHGVEEVRRHGDTFWLNAHPAN